jgi:hypothetical protein
LLQLRLQQFNFATCLFHTQEHSSVLILKHKKVLFALQCYQTFLLSSFSCSVCHNNKQQK